MAGCASGWRPTWARLEELQEGAIDRLIEAFRRFSKKEWARKKAD